MKAMRVLLALAVFTSAAAIECTFYDRLEESSEVESGDCVFDRGEDRPPIEMGDFPSPVKATCSVDGSDPMPRNVIGVNDDFRIESVTKNEITFTDGAPAPSGEDGIFDAQYAATRNGDAVIVTGQYSRDGQDYWTVIMEFKFKVDAEPGVASETKQDCSVAVDGTEFADQCYLSLKVFEEGGDMLVADGGCAPADYAVESSEVKAEIDCTQWAKNDAGENTDCLAGTYVCESNDCNATIDVDAVGIWEPPVQGCWEGAIGFGALEGCFDNLAVYGPDGTDEYFDSDPSDNEATYPDGTKNSCSDSDSEALSQFSEASDWKDWCNGEANCAFRDNEGTYMCVGIGQEEVNMSDVTWDQGESIPGYDTDCMGDACIGVDVTYGGAVRVLMKVKDGQTKAWLKVEDADVLAAEDSYCDTNYGGWSRYKTGNHNADGGCSGDARCTSGPMGRCDINSTLQAKKDAWRAKFTDGAVRCDKRTKKAYDEDDWGGTSAGQGVCFYIRGGSTYDGWSQEQECNSSKTNQSDCEAVQTEDQTQKVCEVKQDCMSGTIEVALSELYQIGEVAPDLIGWTGSDSDPTNGASSPIVDQAHLFHDYNDASVNVLSTSFLTAEYHTVLNGDEANAYAAQLGAITDQFGSPEMGDDGFLHYTPEDGETPQVTDVYGNPRNVLRFAIDIGAYKDLVLEGGGGAATIVGVTQDNFQVKGEQADEAYLNTKLESQTWRRHDPLKILYQTTPTDFEIRYAVYYDGDQVTITTGVRKDYECNAGNSNYGEDCALFDGCVLDDYAVKFGMTAEQSQCTAAVNGLTYDNSESDEDSAFVSGCRGSVGFCKDINPTGTCSDTITGNESYTNQIDCEDDAGTWTPTVANLTTRALCMHEGEGPKGTWENFCDIRSPMVNKCKWMVEPDMSTQENERAQCENGFGDDLCYYGKPKIEIPAPGDDAYDMIDVPTEGMPEHEIPPVFKMKAKSGESAKCFTAVSYDPNKGAYFVSGVDKVNGPKLSCDKYKMSAAFLWEHINMDENLMTEVCDAGVVFGAKDFLADATGAAFIERIEQGRFGEIVANEAEGTQYKNALYIVRQFKDENDAVTFTCGFFGGASPMPGFSDTVGAGVCTCSKPYCNDGTQVKQILDELASTVVNFLEADFSAMASDANAIKAGLAVNSSGDACSDGNADCTLDLEIVANLTDEEITSLAGIAGMSDYLSEDDIKQFRTDLAFMKTKYETFIDTLPDEVKAASIASGDATEEEIEQAVDAANAVVEGLFDENGNVSIGVLDTLTDDDIAALEAVEDPLIESIVDSLSSAKSKASDLIQDEDAAMGTEGKDSEDKETAGTETDTPIKNDDEPREESPATAVSAAAAVLALLAL